MSFPFKLVVVVAAVAAVVVVVVAVVVVVNQDNGLTYLQPFGCFEERPKTNEGLKN